MLGKEREMRRVVRTWRPFACKSCGRPAAISDEAGHRPFLVPTSTQFGKEKEMRRVICTIVGMALVVTLAGTVAAVVSPPCTLTSRHGSVTVSLGGFGGDNVTGIVTDAGGLVVEGAEVDVVNRKTKDAGNDQTNEHGRYSTDVNAASGHVVDVWVTWTDARGGTHEVQGTCTL
jgi:hypothetical protein